MGYLYLCDVFVPIENSDKQPTKIPSIEDALKIHGRKKKMKK